MISRNMLLTSMSTKKSRPYQKTLSSDIDNAWRAGFRNVMPVLPTGGGKTWVFTEKIAQHNGYSCAVAHRQELIGQISLALNKREIPHFAFVPKKIVTWICALHMAEHGRSFYTPNSRTAVAGVDTLLARKNQVADWCKKVSLWVIDEGHHVLKKNKWGRALSLFPDSAYGLLPTATPERADGYGLGKEFDGVVDALIIGPTGRELMSMGYLSDYTIYGPQTQLGLTNDDIGASGDYVRAKLIKKTKESKIVGDVVEHYLKLAPGKLGITFVPSVDIAADIAAAFRAAGVPAEAISAKTPDPIRFEANRRLANGDLKQLVNVDIFGEGYDCPAIEVVSFARATESYPLFSQQFGRGLRVMKGKDKAIFIDHVGNFIRHALRFGTPDTRDTWTLHRRDKKEREASNGIQFKTCTKCFGLYEAYYKYCPYCGFYMVPTDRSCPKFVDGDLTEFSPELLSQLRNEISRIDTPAGTVRDNMLKAHYSKTIALSVAKKHRLRSEAQAKLREMIALWAGWQRHLGNDDSISYRRFHFKFGVDVLTAQTLGRKEAEELTAKLKKEMYGEGS